MTPSLMKITTKHHKHLNNPFPSPPPSTPLLHGTLFSSLPSPQLLPIGHHFHLSFTTSNGSPSISISHSSTPKKQPLWSTLQGEPFVSGSVVKTEVEESRGSFAIRDGEFLAVCNHQTVDDIRVFHSPEDVEFGFGFDLEGIVFPVCVVSGLVFSNERCRKGGSFSANYSILFAQKGDYQVGFEVRFGEIIKQQLNFKPFSGRNRIYPNLRWNSSGFWRSGEFKSSLYSDDYDCLWECDTNLLEFNRVFLTYRSEEDERFFGFGEQFSYIEFKGKRVPIFVQEQGIGRGDQPITFAANLVSYRAGGDSSTTYAPSPFYMTSKMRSLYLEGYDYSIFDLTKSDRVQIQIHNRSAKGRILHGNSPSELIERFTATTGRPPKLPNWIISGAVVGMQGGTEAVRRVWDQLQDHDVPVSSFWLQDWVGQRETMIGSQLWWNWELDSTHYSEWSNLVRDLSSHNIKVMAYCNPCLAPVNGKSNKTRDMFSEASNLGILVENKDGSTYMVPNTAFDVGMLDFTNPLAVKWFKKILQQMVDCGIRGWMADFGEGLPLDATLHSGEDPITAHNRYPELWARVNREFVDEWKSNCDGNEKEDPDESLVFFTRAGFRGNSKWAMLFWEGDQMVSWQKNDGIKSSVVGLLSGGLSGLAFNHSDIGGYCTANLGFVKYQRSEELLIRWMELNAFSTVFRSHEGNKPSYNSQFYSNNNTLSHFSRCAKIYKAWLFYRIQLVEEAAQKGLPVARHLFLHYPYDEHVWNLSYEQFMIGTEIMVVPVLDKGVKKVKVYFPVAGGSSWKHVWSGNVFSRPSNFSGYKEHGFEEWVEAPIGFPAVFVKVGSVVGETFLRNLRDLDVL